METFGHGHCLRYNYQIGLIVTGVHAHVVLCSYDLVSVCVEHTKAQTLLARWKLT